ncbi:MAG: hypothetical protein CMB82_00745 [Flammeovirgaceae bacterium]|nr:hypothetical protein [Flammeovirgaceae bacterium]|tara:strand:+ start:854 stop:1555 length:702 start_codon:yes stop_codon:yes gene_type:complete
MEKNITKYVIEFIVIVFSITISFFLENKRIENEIKNREKLIKINLINELNNANEYLQSRDKAYSVDLDFLNALLEKEVDLDSLHRIGLDGAGYYNSICFWRNFNPPKAIYSSLVSDGEINLIEGIEIKELLYRIYVLTPEYLNVHIEGDKRAAIEIESYLITNYPKLFNKGLVTNDNIKILKELRNIVFLDDTLMALLKRKQLRMDSKLGVFRNYLRLRESIKGKWNFNDKND